MRIEKVAVTYGELRSVGYPNFTNKRYEITLEARLQAGDTARGVQKKLTELARNNVRGSFGEVTENQCELDIPFQ